MMWLLLASDPGLDWTTLITGGGTAAVIALALYIVYNFSNEKWTPGARTARLEGQVTMLTQALASKSEGERELTSVLRDQTSELKAYRQLMEQGAARDRARTGPRGTGRGG